MAMNYAEQQETLTNFMKEFLCPDADGVEHYKYAELLQRVSNREEKVVNIHVDDLIQYGQDELAAKVERNTLRYINMFCTVIDELLPAPTVELDALEASPLDMHIRHRMSLRNNGNVDVDMDPRKHYPAELMRRYELRIIPSSQTKVKSVREIKADSIGRLVSVR
eukprot:Colp12_sorted_trinity150504_noHs@10580